MEKLPLEGKDLLVVDGNTLLVSGRGTSTAIKISGIVTPDTVEKPARTSAGYSMPELNRLLVNNRGNIDIYVDSERMKLYDNLVGIIVITKVSESPKAPAFVLPVKSGLRSEDHTENTYGGFQAMNSNRGDFIAARGRHNPLSMGVANSMIEDVLGSDYKAWTDAVSHLKGMAGSTGKFHFLDLETTGLKASDPIIEAAYSVIHGKGHRVYNWAIDPALPVLSTGGPEELARVMTSPYDSPVVDQYRKHLMYPGSSVTKQIPQGVPYLGDLSTMDMDAVKLLMAQSDMPEAYKQAQLKHISSLMSQGKTSDMSSVMKSILEPGATGREFLFIQNPIFEAGKIAPHISDADFKRYVKSGRLGAGSPEYKSIYSAFDKNLQELLSKATGLELTGGALEDIATVRKDWYTGLRSFMDTAPSGRYTVDIRDITKSVFAMGGLVDPSLHMATSGVTGQDVLGRILGLSKEQHLALPDKLQSQIILSKLLKMGDTLAAGEITPDILEVFNRAKSVQQASALSGVYKDVARRVQAGDTHAVLLTDTKRITPRGDYYRAGELLDRADVPVIQYMDKSRGRSVPLEEYAETRLRRVGVSQVEAPTIVADMFDVINKGSQRVIDMQAYDVAEDVLSRRGAFKALAGSASFTATAKALSDSIMGIEPEITTGDLKNRLMSALDRAPESARAAWDKLSIRHKRGVKIAGAIGLTLGIAGAIRGSIEARHDAHPNIELLSPPNVIPEPVYPSHDVMSSSSQIDDMMLEAHLRSSNVINASKHPGRYYGV